MIRAVIALMTLMSFNLNAQSRTESYDTFEAFNCLADLRMRTNTGNIDEIRQGYIPVGGSQGLMIYNGGIQRLSGVPSDLILTGGKVSCRIETAREAARAGGPSEVNVTYNVGINGQTSTSNDNPSRTSCKGTLLPDRLSGANLKLVRAALLAEVQRSLKPGRKFQADAWAKRQLLYTCSKILDGERNYPADWKKLVAEEEDDRSKPSDVESIFLGPRQIRKGGAR